MKILTAPQIRELDEYTIKNEPIASLDLMERASVAFCDWFRAQFRYANRPVHVFCGMGNNGGDGLAVARLLHHAGYELTVHLCRFSGQGSPDFEANLKRLPRRGTIELNELYEGSPLAELPAGALLVDALFGSGLNRPVSGYWAELLQHLNAQPATRIAIDIPSGLYADRAADGPCFQADYTLSFELPKLAFFLPGTAEAVGKWSVAHIGLHPEGLAQADTPYHYVDEEMAARLYRPRGKFSHKGTYGHALLIAGSYGKMGAAVLAGRAALRAGVGLLSLHIPKAGYDIVQLALPEAMASVDEGEREISGLPDLTPYRAIGIGCGLGQREGAAKALQQLLREAKLPLVIDADALNLLGQHPSWLLELPPNSLLTPHPKEFERLFGPTEDAFERLALQRQKAQELGIIIVLKGAHTCTALPDGRCFFNSTGNPGMATGGTGDVLTGVLTGLLAQGYPPADAALLGVFLHGLAGDLALQGQSQESLLAGDLVDALGKSWGSYCSLVPK